jgi:RNA polymerase sigma-70 factor (ECF subfamily)
MVNPHQEPSQTRTSGTVHEVTPLVKQARAGDRLAFEQLVELFQEAIFRMVYCRTRSSMDAEDLTQDVFIKAFENLHKLKDLERFRTWLFRIAVNRVHDFHRKGRLLAFFGSPSEDSQAHEPDVNNQKDPVVIDHLMKREFWKQVRSLSKRLSRWEREVFFLRFTDLLNIQDIARILGKSESTVKTHLYRALKKFKEEPELLQLLKG